MNLHKNMIIAVFLHDNPFIKLEENDILYWYDSYTKKFYWCKPNSERYKKNYVAKGLEDWYRMYLKLIESEEKDNA